LDRHIALCEIHKTLFEVILSLWTLTKPVEMLTIPETQLFRNFEINLADPLRPCVTDNILTFVVHDKPVILTPREENGLAI
jgi:hypothetical protein